MPPFFLLFFFLEIKMSDLIIRKMHSIISPEQTGLFGCAKDFWLNTSGWLMAVQKCGILVSKDANPNVSSQVEKNKKGLDSNDDDEVGFESQLVAYDM